MIKAIALECKIFPNKTDYNLIQYIVEFIDLILMMKEQLKILLKLIQLLYNL